jgi:hypothetical protein
LSAAEDIRQRWDITIRVQYDPPALTLINGFDIPDLRSIFDQTPGVLWSTLVSPGLPASQLQTELVFGQELVVRTDSGSALLIGSTA